MKNPNAHKPPAPPSEDELKKQMEDALAQTKDAGEE